MLPLSSIVSVIALSLSLMACATPATPVKEMPAAAARLPVSASLQLIAHFDAAKGELPEGLAIAPGAFYVGFAPSSRVVTVDIATGVAKDYGQLPTPVSGKGFMTGLALSPAGEVYAGLASFVPEVQAGIYRIPKEGGAASLFAKDEALPFPNALAFDDSGNLFATDSGTGSVFRINSQGHAERWATGEALTGDKDGCDAAGPGFAIGANGIVVEPSAVYVVNMDKATLVKIPRDAAGDALTPSIVAGPDCGALGGADGLARAPDGSFVVAVNRQNKLVRVTADGAIETIASGSPLDFPATVAFHETNIYATNFALKTASAGKPTTPGIIKLATE